MAHMEINIPCPHCHEKCSVPLSQVSPGNNHVCPHCGARIRFAGQDASKVQQMIDTLTHQAGNVSVKVSVKTNVRRPWWKFWGA